MDTITSLFDGHIAYAFAWTMIHSLWQCTIVAAVLAASLRISRNHSASLRYIQGILALTVCVIISAITFGRYYNGITGVDYAIQALGAGLEIAYSGNLWEKIYVTVNDNLNYILFFWTLGFLFQFCRYSHDFLQALSLKHKDCENVDIEWKNRFDILARRLCIDKNISVRNSYQVSSTCIIGHFKPVILLPVGLLISLPTDQVEALVLHELAHIKRNDYLVNSIQCFVRLLYFFNPAVLWISSKVDVERENACDDIAVQYCGSPKLYARSLANISELELKLANVLAANKHGYQILPRIKRLFGSAHGLSKSMEKLVSAVCVFFVMLTMNVSAKEFDFLKANQTQNTDANIAVNVTEIPKSVQEPANAVMKPDIAPESRKSTVEPASPPTPSENNSSVPVLDASPEADYATKLIAMKETETVPQLERRDQPMQLADATEGSPAANAAKPSGLEPMQTPEFKEFLIASDFKLPLSRKIHIADAQVDFAEIWLKRFQSETSDAYRNIIFKSYGQGLVDALEQSLIESGWRVVDEPAVDAILLTPRLFDLYIIEPETIGIKQTIVPYAGQAAVELVFKTPDSQPFMKIVDYRKTRDSAGSPFVANRTTNYYYFKMLMSDWSDNAVKYLDNVMGIVEKQSGKSD